MKKLLYTLILMMLGTAVAKADSVTITLDEATQSSAAGGTLEFFGTITNDTGETVYLNNDDLNLDGLSFTTTDQFFTTVPISLDAGESSGDIELFDVTVSDPLADAAGTYSGTYTLFGGADGNAQDSLGSTDFSVTTTNPVPEPGSIGLVLSGVAAAWLPISRKLRSLGSERVR